MILIDEWVAYARSLVGRDDLAGGTFDDQFTFAQSLTEAVKGTPGRAAGDLDPRVGERRRRRSRSPATPRRSAARTASRRSSACRTSCAASPTSGGPRRRTRRTTSSASGCSSRRTPTRWRRSARRRAAFVEMYRKHADDFPREARDGSLRGPDQADLPDPPRAVRPPLRGLVDPRALPAHPRRAAPDEHRHPRAVGRRGPVAADHARVDPDRRPRR